VGDLGDVEVPLRELGQHAVAVEADAALTGRMALAADDQQVAVAAERPGRTARADGQVPRGAPEESRAATQ
jgi:hypothetical protein